MIDKIADVPARNVTFFDSLSPEDICNVLRYFHNSPHAKCCKGYVLYENLQSFYVGEAIVSDIWRRLFTEIHYLDFLGPKCGVENYLSISNPDGFEILMDAIRAGGPHLTRLSLTSTCHIGEEMIHPLVPAI